MTTARLIWRAFLLLLLFQVCALAQSPKNYEVKISLLGKGSVELTSSLAATIPGPSQTFTESGKISIPEGYSVTLHFPPSPGYRLESVSDNGEAVLVRAIILPPSYGFEIHEDHSVAVKFIIDSPTGTFPLQFRDGTQAIPIVDITGTYTGLLPTKKNPYSVDVTMDEAGKIDGIGSVNGFLDKNGENMLHGMGSLKTRGGKPVASGNASTAGTLDGDPVSGSGTGKLPIVINNENGGPEIDDAVLAGTGKENGKRFTQPRAMVDDIPAQPANVDKSWSLDLTLTEKENTKGVKYIAASAILNLPNGDRTKFAEKKAKYSLKRGYSISFVRGIQIDSQGNPIPNSKGDPTVDRKSAIMIVKMLLERNGAVWEPTEGTLKYRFLGQKGQGSVLDFAPAN